MKHHIRDFIHGCSVCQRHKTKTLQPKGLLNSFPIPNQIWTDISLDFVEGLPMSFGKNIILVVMHRFSKYCHLLSTAYPYSVVSIARLLFDNIGKLHGLPMTMVSDRDVTFACTFWKGLFHLCGSKLCFNSSYHPRSDGQTEAVNRTIEMYLRCY